jgi:hypothetical protein
MVHLTIEDKETLEAIARCLFLQQYLHRATRLIRNLTEEDAVIVYFLLISNTQTGSEYSRVAERIREGARFNMM